MRSVRLFNPPCSGGRGQPGPGKIYCGLGSLTSVKSRVALSALNLIISPRTGFIELCGLPESLESALIYVTRCV